MRILIHDFAGHAFQVQLSRELASRGHTVVHAYAGGLQGPKGKLERAQTDSDRLRIQCVPLSDTFRKYSPWRRLIAQRTYARDLQTLIAREGFDVVMSGNMPIDAQAELLRYCRRSGVPFVHWVQDVYSHALHFYLRKKIPVLAGPVSFPFRRLERWVTQKSSAIVAIAPQFRDLIADWGIDPAKIQVIQNWAPLDEIAVLPKVNPWAREQGLTDHTVFLYSGSLAMKHRPDLMYSLAKNLGSSCRVVVISEGTGVDYLRQQPPLENLLVMGFQPYNRLSEVLASADVLLATLESSAAVFAVPSKILTYLCAGRPLLFAAPAENLSSAIVRESGGGISLEVGESRNGNSEWMRAAQMLADDSDTRARLGLKARQYAERTFDIGRIADRFEGVLMEVSGQENQLRHAVAQ